MTDIVWLLRNDVPCGAGVCCAGELCNQAADEIERLRNVLENAQQARVLQGKAIIDAANEIERLRKDLSLAVFADNEYWQVLEKENERLRAALERIAFGKYHWEADAQEEARAALEVKND